MELRGPITTIKGVGPALQKTLEYLGIRTVQDLIEYYPRAYDDFSEITTIAELKPGPSTIAARITQVAGRYVRRGMHITEAVATDNTGSVRLVWFNQPYRAASIKPNVQYFISGEFALSHQKFAIVSPACERSSDFPVNTARIVPVYRETKGITSQQIRKLIAATQEVINNLPESLPDTIIQEYRLMTYAEAANAIHFPKNTEELRLAKYRLGFNEVFELSLAAELNKRANSQDTAPPITFNQTLAKEFVSHLPFTLTDDQRRVTWQIYQDMAQSKPMNRLIEGDVGSGKTVVAAMAALMAIKQDYQAALMAPTELLARQHAETVVSMLKKLSYADTVVLLTGGMTPKQKQVARQRIADGTAKFIIGTHSLIQATVDMPKLGLVIIDEQHRFGVEQRKKLIGKAGLSPHILTMTATPIPRSLALTLYGELDISIIHNRPNNRLPIKTKLVSPNSIDQIYKLVDEQITAGRQAFVVCPLVKENSSNPNAAAEATYKQLEKVFNNRRVWLLHGQMSAVQKAEVMEAFASGKIDLLISTTVIEVGVDVPNATVMLVKNADQFGLAQLHQLRGRVGRSSHQGYCYLILSDSKAPSKRLRAIETTDNGFRLAELDLELRGPGAIYGSMQHGVLDLRIANLTDINLITSARIAAVQAIDDGINLLDYKHLAARVNKLRAVTNLN